VELVFRALADAHRRALLDALFECDGQSLGQLAATLPEMTRFGVAKHLAVLEEGGLVVTRRAGRSKLHYLNPVPIRLVHDRWISKYAAPWAGALADLKAELERETDSVDRATPAEPVAPAHPVVPARSAVPAQPVVA
jgi:DNA-binding transcriptional ArsR family regulator